MAVTSAGAAVLAKIHAIQAYNADLVHRLAEREEEVDRLQDENARLCVRIDDLEREVAGRCESGELESPAKLDAVAVEELAQRLEGAGVRLPTARDQRPGKGRRSRPPCKTVEELHQELQDKVSQLTFEGGAVRRHVEFLQARVLCDVGGQLRSLLERDRFELVGDRIGLMLPLRRKIRAGDGWRDALRSALSDKLGVDEACQGACFAIDESSYQVTEASDLEHEYPLLKTISRVHAVTVWVRAQPDGEQAAVAETLKSIGLPKGNDFVTREYKDGQLRLHVWCWAECVQERLEKVAEFERYLAERGVDTSLFGTGSMKSLHQLYVEVNEFKESFLQEVPLPDGGTEILRTLMLLQVRLIVEVKRQKRILMSTEQYLDDGRRRKIRQLLVHKLRAGERWQDEVANAFAERLGVDFATQDACFVLESGEPVYEETSRWSTGYPIRTVYKVWTVTVTIPDPNHPALQELGLPMGSSFVSKEGKLGNDRGGRLHVWSWDPLQGGEDDEHNFAGTAYEELCRTLHEAENLVLQTTHHAQLTELGLDAPLEQVLHKIQSCLGKLTDIDMLMQEVDVKCLVRRSSNVGASNVLTEFIAANYTRNGQVAEKQSHPMALTRMDSETVEAVCSGPKPTWLPAMLEAVRGSVDTWGLDFFELNEQVGGSVLQSYGEVALGPLCKALRCGPDSVSGFLDRTASLYYANPYHNAVHAAQVCHASNWLARTIGLMHHQTGLERAAFLIAALCHDVKHFGRNNAFCVSTQHALALLYNDQRVLENMHSATTFTILQDDDAGNMLHRLPRKDQSAVRTQIIEYILSTDMSEHFQAISKFRVRRESADFSVESEPDRRFLAQMCLKAGDICHAALPWDVHLRWSQRVNQEFLEQGDEEKRLGLPVSALCDRENVGDLGKSQRGFIEFVCLPLFEELANYHAEHEDRVVESRSRKMLEADALAEESPRPADDSGSVISPQSARQAAPLKRRHTRRLPTTASVRETAVQQRCTSQLRSNAARWVEDAESVARVLHALLGKPGPQEGDPCSGAPN